jgi:hypothetical protein
MIRAAEVGSGPCNKPNDSRTNEINDEKVLADVRIIAHNLVFDGIYQRKPKYEAQTGFCH